MDFLEGRTLWERLKDKSPLPKNEALHIAEEIARGLDAAHEEGVIHCDLKPGNIMLVPRRGNTRAVILGIALRLARTMTRASRWAVLLDNLAMLLGSSMVPSLCRILRSATKDACR
jgi:serine/threonine protein kinase